MSSISRGVGRSNLLKLLVTGVLTGGVSTSTGCVEVAAGAIGYGIAKSQENERIEMERAYWRQEAIANANRQQQPQIIVVQQPGGSSQITTVRGPLYQLIASNSPWIDRDGNGVCNQEDFVHQYNFKVGETAHFTLAQAIPADIVDARFCLVGTMTRRDLPQLLASFNGDGQSFNPSSPAQYSVTITQEMVDNNDCWFASWYSGDQPLASKRIFLKRSN